MAPSGKMYSVKGRGDEVVQIVKYLDCRGREIQNPAKCEAVVVQVVDSTLRYTVPVSDLTGILDEGV